MTNIEFAMEMDVIYENINKGGGIGLDPYEKSVILTRAQELLVYELANKDLSLLSSLVKTSRLLPIDISALTYPKIDERSTIFKLPDNYLRILNEVVYSYTVDPIGDPGGEEPTPGETIQLPLSALRYSVIPISFEQYTVLMAKPYNYPHRRTAWRLLNTGGEIPLYIEILSRANTLSPLKGLAEYRITYLVVPTPIILEALATGESIRGINTESETNLIESLHPFILDKAVTLAEQYYYDKYGNPQSQQQTE